MFKSAQSKPSHAVLHELNCWRCGVILVVEVPKGEGSYPCVCGAQLEIRLSQAA